MNLNHPIDYVICAAGEGRRLKQALPHLPKPLAKLKGITLLERSLSSLRFKAGDRVIIISKKSHLIRQRLERRLKNKFKSTDIKWLELDNPTNGQLETALQAKDQLRPQTPVVIFNADTYFKASSDWAIPDDVDGIIPCAQAEGDSWSFCDVDDKGFVRRVTEKERISDHASVGYYYFRTTDLFFNAAQAELDATLPGRETYVAPIYNHLISQGKKIISPKVEVFQPMGTIEQLQTFWHLSSNELTEENQSYLLNYAAGFIGFLFSLLLFSPGFLDNDTFWQLQQATQNVYSDWHPPLLAYLWHWMLLALPNSWGPFLINNVGFWLGLTLTIGSFFKSRPQLAPLLILSLGLCPWMFTYNALLWKDAAYGSALLLATGLILQGEGRRSLFWILVAWVCLFYATGVRHNGIAGTVSLFFLLGRSFRWPIISGAVMTTTAFFLNAGISSLIAPPGAPGQVLTTFDLAGISVNANTNVFPPLYHLDVSDLRTTYNPHNVQSLLWSESPDDHRTRPQFIEEKDYRETIMAWLGAIVNHPKDYLKHRFAFTKALLGIHIGPEGGRIYFTKNLLPQNFSLFRADWLTKSFVGWIIKMENQSVFFRGYFYFIGLFF
jgi:dTDP-glucose pyrophosphorylase